MAKDTLTGNAETNPNTDEGGKIEVTSEAELMRRRAVAAATDDASASHQGGMGAQGGAADFGNPKNFAS